MTDLPGRLSDLDDELRSLGRAADVADLLRAAGHPGRDLRAIDELLDAIQAGAVLLDRASVPRPFDGGATQEQTADDLPGEAASEPEGDRLRDSSADLAISVELDDALLELDESVPPGSAPLSEPARFGAGGEGTVVEPTSDAPGRRPSGGFVALGTSDFEAISESPAPATGDVSTDGVLDALLPPSSESGDSDGFDETPGQTLVVNVADLEELALSRQPDDRPSVDAIVVEEPPADESARPESLTPSIRVEGGPDDALEDVMGAEPDAFDLGVGDGAVDAATAIYSPGAGDDLDLDFSEAGTVASAPPAAARAGDLPSDEAELDAWLAESQAPPPGDAAAPSSESTAVDPTLPDAAPGATPSSAPEGEGGEKKGFFKKLFTGKKKA